MLAEKDRILILDHKTCRDFLERPKVTLMMGLKGGPPCEMFKSVLEEVAGKFPRVRFGVAWLNTAAELHRLLQTHEEVVDYMGRYPATLFVENGSVVGSMVGYHSAAEAHSRISKVFGLRKSRVD